VNEENVYLCTGNPLPKDIETIMDHLMNSSFQDAYDGMHEHISSM